MRLTRLLQEAELPMTSILTSLTHGTTVLGVLAAGAEHELVRRTCGVEVVSDGREE